MGLENNDGKCFRKLTDIITGLSGVLDWSIAEFKC